MTRFFLLVRMPAEHVESTKLLTTLPISECNFANLAGPCSSTGMHPRGAKSMRVRTLQFLTYCVFESSKSLQSASEVFCARGRTGLRPVPCSYNSFTERAVALQKLILEYVCLTKHVLCSLLQSSHASTHEPCADLVTQF